MILSMYKETLPHTRARLQDKWNHRGDPRRILLSGMNVGGTGLNLQKASRMACLVDMPESLSHLAQCFGRQRRNGQVMRCIFFTLVVSGSYDMKLLRYVAILKYPILRSIANYVSSSNVEDAIAVTASLMQQATPLDLHDPDNDMAHRFRNRWLCGYFIVNEDGESCIHHVGTQEGSATIQYLRDSKVLKDDELPMLLPPDEALAYLIKHNSSAQVKWHVGVGHPDLDDMETYIWRELAQRAMIDPSLAEEDTELRRRVRNATRGEGNTVIEDEPAEEYKEDADTDADLIYDTIQPLTRQRRRVVDEDSSEEETLEDDEDENGVLLSSDDEHAVGALDLSGQRHAPASSTHTPIRTPRKRRLSPDHLGHTPPPESSRNTPNTSTEKPTQSPKKAELLAKKRKLVLGKQKQTATISSPPSCSRSSSSLSPAPDSSPTHASPGNLLSTERNGQASDNNSEHAAPLRPGLQELLDKNNDWANLYQTSAQFRAMFATVPTAAEYAAMSSSEKSKSTSGLKKTFTTYGQVYKPPKPSNK